MKHMSFIEFKGSLGYSSLYRSMQFWCHDTALKKIFSIEKLNLVGYVGINLWWGEYKFVGGSLLGRFFPVRGG